MKILILFLFILFPAIMKSQDIIPSSTEALRKAEESASKEHKKIFLMFHASWCGWCKKMDKSMEDPAISKFFTNNYIIVHLTVMESPTKKSLENPGAFDLMKKYNADNAGLPFFVILNPDGDLLADSYIKPLEGKVAPGKLKNTGCPSEENEVAYFISILKKTSSLKDKELAMIAERFKKNKS